MKRLLGLIALFGFLAASAAAAEIKPPEVLVAGLKNPAAVTLGADGRIYVTEIGDPDKPLDGKVLVIDHGNAVPFATELEEPRGIVPWKKGIFVAAKQIVLQLDPKGVPVPFGFQPPRPLLPQAGIAVDERGALYVSEKTKTGTNEGVIWRYDERLNGPNTAVDFKKNPLIKNPGALAMDGRSFLLAVDFDSGDLLRIAVADGATTKVAEGLGQGAGLAWDPFGRLYVSDWKSGKVFVIPRPGDKPIVLASGFQHPAGICVNPATKSLLVVDAGAGTLSSVSAAVPGQEVDEKPLSLRTEVAFPNLQWAGWKPETDDGRLVAFRPIVLTHAGDGSNRNFVATQRGVIHVFPNDPKAAKTEVFLDIQDRVVYNDKQNEEGFLGLTFHPDFKRNGEFFVFYTTKTAPSTNVVSRFRVSKDNPYRADPASEEELLRIKKPFWNHDGGTLCFGSDGKLYIAVGDGGLANDPFKNGQKLKTFQGKVLRIDVDHKDPGKNYAVPADNPFVGRADAFPEVWAYGLRNIWRMAFDRKTGTLWASDVGQDLFEEIDLIVKGGNYGWNLREGLHPFGKEGVGPRKDLIEPIWEYRHDVGKSLTGGLVYRGQRLPELEGAYIYADYITGKIWALRYDESKKRVVANRPVTDPKEGIMSFGEDEKGEIYFMIASPSGKGIFQLVK